MNDTSAVFNLLGPVVLLPMVGFLILAALRRRVSETVAAIIGVGSVALSALLVFVMAFAFYGAAHGMAPVSHTFWTWMSVGELQLRMGARLDELSMLMLLVVTGVGALIHLYASWYMRGDPGYGRFFSYMNLFLAAMVLLVLGDSLPVLFIGWEGVGLASYLLIGFWYENPANGYAARKAFIITRVGDTLMMIGLMWLWKDLGTLDIQTILATAPGRLAVGGPVVTSVALLLLGGACGKSAQIPLQTWLPDAMAGPTPVSALIHAATMVTAGVYLIARMNPLFVMAPTAMFATALIGSVTLLAAGFTALVQTDIKRILAYSTMSQIGYMFLALGVGGWHYAIFHLMTHAFFKAMLFLSAGSVILYMHHEQDIFRMGGLRKQIPLVFWCFMIGGLALCAVPPTAGFFSKDEILWQAWATGQKGFFFAGLLGAFLTGVYTFRLIFIVFFNQPLPPGEQAAAHADAHADANGHDPHTGSTDDPGHDHAPTPPLKGWVHGLPLVVLMALSVVGGFIHIPLDRVLPLPVEATGAMATTKNLLAAISVLVSLSGIGVAYLLFWGRRERGKALAASAPARVIAPVWRAAWGFDALYDTLFVKPFVWASRLNRNDFADRVVAGGVPAIARGFNALFTRTQNGGLRWYAAAMAVGLVMMMFLVVRA